MKQYRTIYRVPQYMVQGFGDAGLDECHHEDGTVEKDDLRITIVLSAGHEILLTGKQRMVFEGEEILVQDLIEVKE